MSLPPKDLTLQSMGTDSRTPAETYFDAWPKHDFERLRSVLADDTADAPPAPTANWMHIENGRIARIRVTVDPRAILSP